MAEQYRLQVSQKKQGESDVSYYKRLAKQADLRMRRAEELSKQKGYENVTKWAYANGVQALKELGLGNRWEKAIPKNKSGEVNERELRKRLNAVTNFLELPTSTKSGIKHGYEQRADTINKKYGTNFTWEDIGKFYESKLWNELNKKFGSDTAMRVFATIQSNELSSVQDLNEAIKTASEQNLKIADSEEVLKQVRKSLRKNGVIRKELDVYLESNPFESE